MYRGKLKLLRIFELETLKKTLRLFYPIFHVVNIQKLTYFSKFLQKLLYRVSRIVYIFLNRGFM